MADVELGRDSYNVYVGDLPSDATDDEVRAAFASAGELLEVRIMRDRVTQAVKGYGFIHFATREAYDKVLTAPEYARVVLRSGQRALRVKSSEQKTVLFLGNLPMELTQDEVRDAVLALLQGKIDAASLRVDVKFTPPPERRSKGFGFATFQSNAQAEFARRVLSASTVNGRQVNASWAEHPPAETVRPGAPAAGSAQTTLYVSGLHALVTEDVLSALFEQFGAVSKCLLPRAPHSDELRGFAFVQLPSRADCDRAIAEFDETEFQGHRLRLSIAKPPGEKSNSQSASGKLAGGRASGGRMGAPGAGYGGAPYAARGVGAPYGAPQQPQWGAPYAPFAAQPQWGAYPPQQPQWGAYGQPQQQQQQQQQPRYGQRY